MATRTKADEVTTTEATAPVADAAPIAPTAFAPEPASAKLRPTCPEPTDGCGVPYEYRGTINGGPWYECPVCGHGEIRE